MAIYNKIYNDKDWELVNQENKEILDDFLMEYKQQQKKQSTIAQYFNDGRIIMLYILKFCDNKSILALNKKNFRKFSLWLSEDCGMSPNRANRMMSTCRTMLTFCEDDDDYEYDQNFAAKVKGVPTEMVRDICFVSDDEVTRLIDALVAKEDYQRATLISLLYESAGRKNEICQVEKESFLDDEKNSTNIVIGKRGKKFALVYFSRTKELAKKWLEQRGDDDIPTMWVTCRRDMTHKRQASNETIYQWIVALRDLYEKNEGKYIEFNCHSYRHSALENYNNGTHFVLKELGIEGGFSLDQLKVIANHESIETTAGYLKKDDKKILSGMFGGINFE